MEKGQNDSELDKTGGQRELFQPSVISELHKDFKVGISRQQMLPSYQHLRALFFKLASIKSNPKQMCDTHSSPLTHDT